MHDCKNKLEYHTCIISMNFAEKFCFTIQRSVQSFYYNNTQATTHSFCINYIDLLATNNKFCVISDTTDHITYNVHTFQEKNNKQTFPWIKNCSYFSDGASIQ